MTSPDPASSVTLQADIDPTGTVAEPVQATVSAGATLSVPSVRRMAIAGFSSSLLGIGLARFSYTPLLPAVIEAGWFDPHQASYLGAANLVGYLLGALSAGQMVRLFGNARSLRLMMLVAMLSFFACTLPVSFGWFFAWRVLAGMAGGALMVLAAPTILKHVPSHQAGVITGAIFTGVGIGIALSGTLMPLLLQAGLTMAWLGLGVIAILLTLLAWHGWPRDGAGIAGVPATVSAVPATGHHRRVAAFTLQYGLNAVGLVPHMIFLVDFVARNLGRGIAAGSVYWVLFGLGAMLGPMLAGRGTDRYGARASLRIAYLLQATAVALPLVATDPVSLAISSCIMGATTPGIVPLALARLKDLLPDPTARHRAWTRATAAFALGQAGAAYGFAFLRGYTGSYASIFLFAAIALMIALASDFMIRSRT